MWQQLSLTCSEEEVKNCEEYLLLAGAVSVSLQDAKHQPIFEPMLGSTPLWESNKIIALFEETVDMVSVKKYLKRHLSHYLFQTIQLEAIAEKDWVRESMKDWKPLHFGKKLLICPSSQNDLVTANCIFLDPGLAFGTGTHPTTRLCLEWLDANPPEKKVVIDYGCGSGILGIAAIKLGAKRVYAVDHDIQALKSTEMNAKKNAITKTQIIAIHPKDLQKKLTHKRKDDVSKINAVDLIIANILAIPLIELAPTFAALLKPSGQLVLSGILREQEKEIIHAYDKNFSNFLINSAEDWLCLFATKI